MSKKCDKVDNSCREEKMGCKNCAYDEAGNLEVGGTIIKAKYRLDQKIWVVDVNKERKEVEVYTDIIKGIFLNAEGDIYYFLNELCDDIIESKLIPYENTERLLAEIIKADNEINKE